jgi:hypothetical protein
VHGKTTSLKKMQVLVDELFLSNRAWGGAMNRQLHRHFAFTSTMFLWTRKVDMGSARPKMVLEGADDSGLEGANGDSDDSVSSEGERKVTCLKERLDPGAIEFGQFW